MTGDYTPLWEGRHPYYANQGNYFSNECHAEYDSWASFFSAEGDADPDMNLVYRWDWDATGGSNGVNYLSLFYVGQRKALHRSARIAVLQAEEPVIRAWLVERAKTMAAIWNPVALTLDPSFLREGPDA